MGRLYAVPEVAEVVVALPYSSVTVTGIEPPPGAVSVTAPVTDRPSDHTAASWSAPAPAGPKVAS